MTATITFKRDDLIHKNNVVRGFVSRDNSKFAMKFRGLYGLFGKGVVFLFSFYPLSALIFFRIHKNFLSFQFIDLVQQFLDLWLTHLQKSFRQLYLNEELVQAAVKKV